MSPMSLSRPAVCAVITILVSLSSHGVDGQIQDGYRQAVGCFSNVYNNFLELSCPAGETISVEWVIFGTHPDVACPTDGSLTEEQAHCCAPRCGDCIVENERESANVFSCNKKNDCSVWTRTTWVEGCDPMKVTTYMVALYTCNNTSSSAPDTSAVPRTPPSADQILCGHSGQPTRPGGKLPATESPTNTPAPIVGPRHIVGCYSSFHKQKIEIKCQRGEGIAIYGVFFAAKNDSSCPADGFIIDKDQTDCCVPACGDCVISQTNEASYIYQECSGETECAPWTHRILIENCGPREYTSYMVVHYECLRDFREASKSDANGRLFEEIFGCPLPPTTPSPSTKPPEATKLILPDTKPPVNLPTRKPPATTPTAKRTTTTIPVTTTVQPTTLKNYDGTYVVVGCYSNIYKPKVEISCEADTHILIHGVFFGTRQVAICPKSGLVEEGSEECCEPKCGDCVTFGGHGEVNNLVRECTYQQNCSVWTQRSVMPDCGNQAFTSYMAVHYQCTQTGRDAARPMSFDELYCPPGSVNISRSTQSRPSLSTSTSQPTTRATTTELSFPTSSNHVTTTTRVVSRRTVKTTVRRPEFPGSGIPKPYPSTPEDGDSDSKKVLIGAVVGGVATVLVVGITFVVVLHLRRREKTVVTRGHSLDHKRKRKRNHSKNNSQCTNSTHLNSVAAPSSLAMINVISNSGRLPGKGDYNHLERWLGDLETTGDNFDLPRISEVSESDTDADIESRVRKITTLPYRPPDMLQESDS